MITSNLRNKLIEAIASDSTPVETRILLIEILLDLNQAKEQLDYKTIGLRLIELFIILGDLGSG